MDGYPGDGKSHIAACFAAADSAGRPMLDGSILAPRDILWLSHEKDPHDTSRPLLEALAGFREAGFSVQRDQPLIDRLYE